MTIEYKGKKWNKEVIEFKQYAKSINGNLHSNELFTIDQFKIEKDFLRLYSNLYGDYEQMARIYYLNDINCDEITKYTYLSGYAMLLTNYLYNNGFRTEHITIVKNLISNELNYALYQLIAVDQTDNLYIEQEEENIIMLMYNKKYNQVKLLLDEMPDNPDDFQTVYYIHPMYQKQIYLAIIEHDEKLFNEELTKRIKKYRKNMVGYSTIIDIPSVALIKIANREGLKCTVDVIEIPKQFFDERCKIDKEEVKLPFFDDLQEILNIAS